MVLDQEFRYGWCYTDHKEGKYLRKDWRKIDYFQSPSTKKFVEKTLKMYGVPMPSIENEVFRGTSHDLLFLDSHGVVIRVGITKVEQLLNPAIIQPLHWVDDPNSGVTVALYPGVELFKTISQEDNPFGAGPELHQRVKMFGNRSSDIVNAEGNTNITNVGYLRIYHEGENLALPVGIDPDHIFLASTGLKPSISSSFSSSLQENVMSFEEGLTSVYQAVVNNRSLKKEAEPYVHAIDYHKPIRRAFARAFKNGSVNQQALAQAWEMTRNFHEKGYSFWKKDPVSNKKQSVETRRLFSPWSYQNGLSWGNVAIYDMKREDRTYQACLTRVLEQGEEIEHVPEGMIDDDFAIQFLKKWGNFNYGMLPNHYKKTYNFWLRYVKELDGRISIIPKRFYKRELLNEAIKAGDHRVLAHLSEKAKSKSLCLFALKHSTLALAYVPDRYKTEEVCLDAFERDKLSIIDAPSDFITEERLREAINHGMGAHSFSALPKEKQSKAMVAALFKSHPLSAILELWRSFDFQSPDFVEALKAEYGYQDDKEISTIWDIILKVGDQALIQQVIMRREFLTPDHFEKFILAAPKETLSHLYWVNDDRLSPQLLDKAIDLDHTLVDSINPANFTKKAWRFYIHRYPYEIYQVPPEYVTWDMCAKAIRHDEHLVASIDEKNMTRALSAYAFKKNYEILKDLPEHHVTQEMCEIFIQKKPNALAHIPEHLRTKEICLTALRHHQEVQETLQFVPKNLMDDRDFILQASVSGGLAIASIPEKWLRDDAFLADYKKFKCQKKNYSHFVVKKLSKRVEKMLSEFNEKSVQYQVLDEVRQRISRFDKVQKNYMRL